jgi:hypothetical protein
MLIVKSGWAHFCLCYKMPPFTMKHVPINRKGNTHGILKIYFNFSIIYSKSVYLTQMSVVEEHKPAVFIRFCPYAFVCF